MQSLLKHFFKPAFLFFTSKEYRALQRIKAAYGKQKQYTTATIKFKQFEVTVPDVKSFSDQYESIFYENCYAFQAKNDAPIIYDCGANIGMAALYFARHYPNAKLHCFEADPAIAQLLKENLKKNNCAANVIDKAVWIDDGGVNFLREGGQGGRVDDLETTQKVESVRLKSLLAKESKIDFLKLDIEGAELEVLIDCFSELHKVDYLFVEFHFYSNRKNNLSKLLAILETANFNYFVQNNNVNAPFQQQMKKAVSFTVEIFAQKNTLKS